MNYHPVIQTQAGAIKICTVFDFVREVRKEYVPITVQQINTVKRNFYQSSAHRYMPNPYEPAEALSKTWHILKQNPASILVELKKTTTLKERKSKNVDFERLLEELVVESLIGYGQPTHLFPIGSHRYALVCAEDVRLFTKADFSQSLVCVQPHRNFTVYAPHLKVGGQ